jgi:trimeric autotransporter adhesin
MNVFASLQFPRTNGQSDLKTNAGFSFRVLIPVVLLALAVLVLPANSQNVNIIKTIAGGGTVNPSPLLADIPGPTSVIGDKNGNLYVAAPFAQYIFESSGGVVSQFVGMGVIGDRTKTGSAGTQPLWNAYSVAVDSKGNVYIADTNNNDVHKVDATGTVTTIAGNSKPCPQARCGDHGPAIKAKLNNPQSVAVDAAGNIYIADSGDNRIRVVRVDGNIYPFASNWNVATCNSPTSPCGDGGPALQSSFNDPVSLILNGGNLYVSDTGDNRVRIISMKTHVISAFAGNGKTCAATGVCGDGGAALNANLNKPRGLSIDKTGNFYVADTNDNRIRIVTAGTIGTFAGTGGRGFQGDGSTALTALLAGPNGVFADAKGNVFIADTGNQRIREVTKGTINTVLGGGDGGDGASTAAQFANPDGVALDSANNYYIADTSNNRVREVSGNTVQTIAGNGLNGYSGDGGSALNAELSSPAALVIDGSGNVLIADTNNRVVREVSGGNINPFAGNGSPCTPTGICGDGGSAVDANLTGPTALAIDKSGNIFIADPSTQRVREVSNGIITTVAGNGTAGYKGDGSLATSAELDRPTGVVVDGSGNIYIADAGNNVIRCVLGAAGGCGDVVQKYAVGDIITYAYDGNILFQGDGGPAILASRWNPTQLALDSRGNLFIGGGNDEEVQRIDLATGIIVTVAGNDKQWWYYGFWGDGRSATQAIIDNAGLAIGSDESLYIADAGNNRIREVATLVPVAALAPKSFNFGDVQVGQNSQPLAVTLTNTGSDDMALGAIVTTGDFTQTNSCPAMLAPSQNCTISVTFTPTQKGHRTGQLQVNDNAPLSPQTVKLVGTGT